MLSSQRYRYGCTWRGTQKKPLDFSKGFFLRDRLHSSNYVLVKIAVDIHNLGHGERLACMDSDRLPEAPELTGLDIQSLFEKRLASLRPE